MSSLKGNGLANVFTVIGCVSVCSATKDAR
jgi:hypothetical protein